MGMLMHYTLMAQLGQEEEQEDRKEEKPVETKEPEAPAKKPGRRKATK